MDCSTRHASALEMYVKNIFFFFEIKAKGGRKTVPNYNTFYVNHKTSQKNIMNWENSGRYVH